MSKNSGALIRLIDVVLTLFFGFIMIADLDPHSRLDLQRASKATEATQEEQVTYTIEVRPDQTFLVGEKGVEKGKTIDRKIPIERLEDLEEFMDSEIRRKENFVIKIRPQDGTKVQQSVDVLDLCQKFSITSAVLDMD